jgi:hypothetical protein
LVTRNRTLGKTVTDAFGEHRPGARARTETAVEISLAVSSENPGKKSQIAKVFQGNNYKRYSKIILE